MDDATSIREAEFNPKVCTYWLLSSTLILAATIVGIPLVPFWFLFGTAFTRRYLASMHCSLTPKTLEIKKGVLIRVEKTVPLEKITDLGMLQGPVMRHFDLYRLSVETAGQSAPGALVTLTGIVDAKGFREAVLAQRDATAASTPREQEKRAATATDAPSPVLTEIRDILVRIERKLGDNATN